MPTLLELAGIDAPDGKFMGRNVLPITGRSLLATQDETSGPIEAGWELMGKRGYRHGDWKLVHLPVPYGSGNWQLYNLAEDPREQRDLSLVNAQKRKEMISGWERYAKANNVILPDWVSGY